MSGVRQMRSCENSSVLSFKGRLSKEYLAQVRKSKEATNYFGKNMQTSSECVTELKIVLLKWQHSTDSKMQIFYAREEIIIS